MRWGSGRAATQLDGLVALWPRLICSLHNASFLSKAKLVGITAVAAVYTINIVFPSGLAF